MFALTTCIQHYSGVLVTLIKQERGGESIEIGKEEVKLTLFAVLRNPKTKKQNKTKKSHETNNKLLESATSKFNIKNHKILRETNLARDLLTSTLKITKHC